MRENRVWMGCLSMVGCLSLAVPALAQSSVETLKEVVVSGSRSERAPDEVPAVVDVLQGTDLDGAQVQDIRDLVRDLPNVSVKRAAQRFGAVAPGGTGRDGNAGFNIRGLEGNRVLLTVDGIRVPRELSSGVFGSASFGRDYVDLGLISRVEILRGASSALYGSDGLAGMVSMLTTEPAELLKKNQAFGGRAVLHDLNLALRYADRVWVLDHGRQQASGSPAEVLTPALLRQIWHVQAHPVADADGCPQLLIRPVLSSTPLCFQEAP